MAHKGTSLSDSTLYSTLLDNLAPSASLSEDETDLQSRDLNALVESIRQHLGMEVAFISRYKDNFREFTHLSIHPECMLNIPVGHKDPSDTTYCQLICEDKLPPIIPDTKKNPITKAMAVTEALNIGSYIGVPIRLSDDRLYGTLCCFSSQPDDSLTHKDLSILSLFAKFAARNIEAELIKYETDEAMRHSIFSMLEQDKLKIVLQPIYGCDQAKIVGFECLARFQSEPYLPPNVWFAKAHNSGIGEVLELYSIQLSLALLDDIPEDTYLTLNVSPEYIHSKALHEILNQYPLSRIVLEVTERESIDDYQSFRDSLAPLRAKGMRLAVDDAGAGFASFQHILELQADIIKLDRSLICNVHEDRSRRALVAALIGFAKETESLVLGEGVETSEEMGALHKLGVSYIQGYYFSYPLPPEKAVELYHATHHCPLDADPTEKTPC